MAKLEIGCAHQYRALRARWQALARRHGWLTETIGTRDGETFDVHWVSGVRAPVSLYLSAGIHGDEPAGPWGLLLWAESASPQLWGQNMLLAPCINPQGLIRNERHGAGATDMNRCFHRVRLGWVRQWRTLMAVARPANALILHEDYDAQGCYLYELTLTAGSQGKRWLKQAAGSLGIDPRRTIDGQRAVTGVIQRPLLERLADGSQPEAMALTAFGCGHSITFETPSEAGFASRVRAHQRLLRYAVPEMLGR
jgi:hypothetical protein